MMPMEEQMSLVAKEISQKESAHVFDQQATEGQNYRNINRYNAVHIQLAQNLFAIEIGRRTGAEPAVVHPCVVDP